MAQHPIMAEYNPTSVNTIRIVTYRDFLKRRKVFYACLRFSEKDSVMDNVCSGGGGNVDACIDMETGMLKYAIQFDGLGKDVEITHHPDSGALLEGVKIEHWSEIVEQVLQFQECFPYCKAAGWDIAITDEGPVVIEVNDFWDRTGQYFIHRGWRNEIRDCYLAWKATGKNYATGSWRLPFKNKRLMAKYNQ